MPTPVSPEVSPSLPVPAASVIVLTDGIAAKADLQKGDASFDFAPLVSNESTQWLRGLSVGIVYYANADAGHVSNALLKRVSVVESPLVNVPSKVRVTPNGASLPLRQDVKLVLRHVVLQPETPDLAPFASVKIQGARGISIPRPLGKAVWWRAAMYVTADGHADPAWFQLSVKSGNNNDMRAHPLTAVRVDDGKATVAYQFREYVEGLGRAAWIPGNDPIASNEP